MRIALLLSAALTLVAIPFGSAQAKPNTFASSSKKGPKDLKVKGKLKEKGKKGKKGKGKKGKGKKGKGKKGQKDEGGDSGSDSGSSFEDTCELPSGVTSMVKGAGQRLSFTFGGKMWVRNGDASGKFFLSFHPQSPSTAIVNVTCSYDEFSNVEITNARAAFRMSGSCKQVFDDGRIERVNATNDVIINNAETDSVSIVTVGGGLSVPAGSLSFGNFQMAGGTPAS